MKELSKKQFYIRSLTWGLPVTFAGSVVALAMMATGHKPQRHGWCWYFEAGDRWGGMDWGPVFITGRSDNPSLRDHEFGHAIQNCYYGPFMPILVTAPSSARYWARRIGERIGRKPSTRYDDIWFEGQASELGRHYIKNVIKKDSSK